MHRKMTYLPLVFEMFSVTDMTSPKGNQISRLRNGQKTAKLLIFLFCMFDTNHSLTVTRYQSHMMQWRYDFTSNHCFVARQAKNRQTVCIDVCEELPCRQTPACLSLNAQIIISQLLNYSRERICCGEVIFTSRVSAKVAWRSWKSSGTKEISCLCQNSNCIPALTHI